MEDSNNYSETDTLKSRGKIAINSAHKNTSVDDERRITKRISDMYEVTIEEANDIHVNYHHDRIRNMLRLRAKKHGMTDTVFEKVYTFEYFKICCKHLSWRADRDGSR